MIVRDGMQQTEQGVLENRSGQRFVSVTLFASDVRQLAKMTPQMLHDWLTESLQARFAPTKLEGEI